MDRKVVYYSNELYHYGVPGQKWGVRNYQNEDGSYKPGAEGRYYDPVGGIRKVVRKVTGDREAKKAAKAKYKAAVDKAYDKEEKAISKIESKYKPGEKLSDEDIAKQDKVFKDYHSDLANAKKAYKEEMAKAGGLSDKQKIALTVGAAVAVAGLAAYATYKISKDNAIALNKSYQRSVDMGEKWIHKQMDERLRGDHGQGISFIGNVHLDNTIDLKNRLDKNLYQRLTKKFNTDLSNVPSSVYVRYKNKNDYGYKYNTLDNIGELLAKAKANGWEDTYRNMVNVDYDIYKNTWSQLNRNK